eukprot:ANDGO_04344.mRNA.1 hypothetical protein
MRLVNWHKRFRRLVSVLSVLLLLIVCASFVCLYVLVQKEWNSDVSVSGHTIANDLNSLGPASFRSLEIRSVLSTDGARVGGRFVSDTFDTYGSLSIDGNTELHRLAASSALLSGDINAGAMSLTNLNIVNSLGTHFAVPVGTIGGDLFVFNDAVLAISSEVRGQFTTFASSVESACIRSLSVRGETTLTIANDMRVRDGHSDGPWYARSWNGDANVTASHVIVNQCLEVSKDVSLGNVTVGGDMFANSSVFNISESLVVGSTSSLESLELTDADVRTGNISITGNISSLSLIADEFCATAFVFLSNETSVASSTAISRDVLTNSSSFDGGSLTCTSFFASHSMLVIGQLTTPFLAVASSPSPKFPSQLQHLQVFSNLSASFLFIDRSDSLSFLDARSANRTDIDVLAATESASISCSLFSASSLTSEKFMISGASSNTACSLVVQGSAVFNASTIPNTFSNLRVADHVGTSGSVHSQCSSCLFTDILVLGNVSCQNLNLMILSGSGQMSITSNTSADLMRSSSLSVSHNISVLRSCFFVSLGQLAPNATSALWIHKALIHNVNSSHLSVMSVANFTLRNNILLHSYGFLEIRALSSLFLYGTANMSAAHVLSFATQVGGAVSVSSSVGASGIVVRGAVVSHTFVARGTNTVASDTSTDTLILDGSVRSVVSTLQTANMSVHVGHVSGIATFGDVTCAGGSAVLAAQNFAFSTGMELNTDFRLSIVNASIGSLSVSGSTTCGYLSTQSLTVSSNISASTLSISPPLLCSSVVGPSSVFVTGEAVISGTFGSQVLVSHAMVSVGTLLSVHGDVMADELFAQQGNIAASVVSFLDSFNIADGPVAICTSSMNCSSWTNQLLSPFLNISRSVEYANRAHVGSLFVSSLSSLHSSVSVGTVLAAGNLTSVQSRVLSPGDLSTSSLATVSVMLKTNLLAEERGIVAGDLQTKSRIAVAPNAFIHGSVFGNASLSSSGSVTLLNNSFLYGSADVLRGITMHSLNSSGSFSNSAPNVVSGSVNLTGGSLTAEFRVDIRGISTVHGQLSVSMSSSHFVTLNSNDVQLSSTTIRLNISSIVFSSDCLNVSSLWSFCSSPRAFYSAPMTISEEGEVSFGGTSLTASRKLTIASAVFLNNAKINVDGTSLLYGNTLRMSAANGSVFIGNTAAPSSWTVHDFAVAGSLQVRGSESVFYAKSTVDVRSAAACSLCGGPLISTRSFSLAVSTDSARNILFDNHMLNGGHAFVSSDPASIPSLLLSSQGSVSVSGPLTQTSMSAPIAFHGISSFQPEVSLFGAVSFQNSTNGRVLLDAFPSETGFRIIHTQSTSGDVFFEKRNTNTGTSGCISFFSGGTEVLSVYPSGYVAVKGSGAPPTAQLDVFGAMKIFADVDVDNGVYFSKITASDPTCLLFLPSSGQEYRLLRTSVSYIAGSGAQYDSFVFEQQSRNTVFTANTFGASRPDFFLGSSGLVGIGTLFPNFNLEINGKGTVQGMLISDQTVVVHDAAIANQFFSHASNGASFLISSTDSFLRLQISKILQMYTSVFLLYPSSVVGIGFPYSSLPSAQFHVNGAANVMQDSTVEDRGLVYVDGGSVSRVLVDSSYLRMQQYNGPNGVRFAIGSKIGSLQFASALTILGVTSDVRIGINTQSPTASLHVAGSSRFEGDMFAQGSLYFQNLYPLSIVPSLGDGSQASSFFRSSVFRGRWNGGSLVTYSVYNFVFAGQSSYQLQFNFGAPYSKVPSCVCSLAGFYAAGLSINVRVQTATEMYAGMLHSSYGWYDWSSVNVEFSIVCFGLL